MRTTLIAGFPGETEEDFEELCEFLEEVEFDYVGVFPYSREEGTRAADLSGQVDEEIKIERAQRIRDIRDAIGESHVSARIGKTMDVLVLGREEDGQLFGRAMCQAPEVDGVVYLEEGAIGDVVKARIEDTLVYEMEGEVVHGE
ncbi:MAG: TRAM domain-containing protein [Slackia sp.]